MITNFQTNAEVLLDGLGRELGIEDLEWDEESNSCVLQINQRRIVVISANPETGDLVLHTQLGALPQEDRCDLVEQLLEANLLWAGTRGATLSIERESGSILLARTITLYTASGALLTGKNLETLIMDLVDVADYWGEQLEEDASTLPEEEITKLD